jgi:hypothetical protein
MLLLLGFAHGNIGGRWAAGSYDGSRRPWPVMKPIDLVRRIDGSANHFDRRSYLLPWRQSMPSQHSLLQGGAVGQSAGPVVQCRGPAGIDVDFVIVAHKYACLGPNLMACGPFMSPQVSVLLVRNTIRLKRLLQDKPG